MDVPRPESRIDGNLTGEPSALTSNLNCEFEVFRPYRQALVKRMHDQFVSLTPEKRDCLERVIMILSGGDDEKALVIQTIAQDSTANSDWKEEHNINVTIDIMLSFFSFY